MESSIFSRAKRAWNVFLNRDPTMDYEYHGPSNTYRVDRVRLSRGNERTIITSIYNRIALDVASIDIRHVKLDEDGRYVDTVNSGLNNCFNLEANIDQNANQFKLDIIMSLLDEGVVALLPVVTDSDPDETGSYSIESMRVGKVKEWYPQHVRIEAYDERTGRKQEVVVSKSSVAIIENPLFAVINEPNSTMQRLVRKLNLLDRVDEDSNSGKLDLIIQLPYVLKSKTQKEQAEKRRQQIEDQLRDSKYGIAYTDGTERIVQLNRAVENNLMSQIEYLTSMLYSQLGMTKEILDGTADEQTMTNYYNRTIEPFVSSISLELKRKFITKTARTQGHSIEYFRDAFKLVPINKLAEISDKMTRNEIMTSNEIRTAIGMKPSNDPSADELRNKNLNQKIESNQNGGSAPAENASDSNDAIVDDFLSTVESQIDEIVGQRMGGGVSA